MKRAGLLLLVLGIILSLSGISQATLINGGAEYDLSGWSTNSDAIQAVTESFSGPNAAIEGDYFFSFSEKADNNLSMTQVGNLDYSSGLLTLSGYISTEPLSTKIDTQDYGIAELEIYSGSTKIGSSTSGILLSVGSWSLFDVTIDLDDAIFQGATSWGVSLNGYIGAGGGSFTSISWDGISLNNTPTPTPTPEPATLLLLGSGLVGFAGFGRKKFFKK